MKRIVFIFCGLMLIAANVFAGNKPATPESNKTAIELVQTHADYVWTLVAAALVFFMQAGFGMVVRRNPFRLFGSFGSGSSIRNF